MIFSRLKILFDFNVTYTKLQLKNQSLLEIGSPEQLFYHMHGIIFV